MPESEMRPDVHFAGSRNAALYDRVWRVLSTYKGYSITEVMDMTGLGQRNVRLALYALEGYGYVTVSRLAGVSYWRRRSQ